MLFHEVKGCDIIKAKDSLTVDVMKNTSKIVHSALKKLNSLPDDIRNGAVTGKEVENYEEQVAKLQVLYEAANIGKTKLVPSFTKVTDALKICVKKLNTVKEYRKKLLVVTDYCKLISEGMCTYSFLFRESSQLVQLLIYIYRC